MKTEIGISTPIRANPGTQDGVLKMFKIQIMSNHNSEILITAPYLVGVLGVPEHPRNLGVHKRGEA